MRDKLRRFYVFHREVIEFWAIAIIVALFVGAAWAVLQMVQQ